MALNIFEQECGLIEVDRSGYESSSRQTGWI